MPSGVPLRQHRQVARAAHAACNTWLLVHRALEIGFLAPTGERTPDVFRSAIERALDEYRIHPDYVDLDLDGEQADAFEKECRELVERYLSMEDPNRVRAIGLELRLEAKAGDLVLRGIIDRLELDDEGELVVTDYKTGRSPSQAYEQRSLAGVHFYSFLCEAVLGRRPKTIRLMYLRTGEVIETAPSERSVRFITTRTKAVYEAVERACGAGDFRPRPSALCNFCAFRDWCPEFGGDPALAVIEAPLRYRPRVAA